MGSDAQATRRRAVVVELRAGVDAEGLGGDAEDGEDGENPDDEQQASHRMTTLSSSLTDLVQFTRPSRTLLGLADYVNA